MTLTAARRYYNESYTLHFEATVGGAPPARAGPLSRLCPAELYPTSGGQPHDIGALGSSKVVDVTIRDRDSALLHVLDTPIAHGPVTASIDGVRRFDHMQQHT